MKNRCVKVKNMNIKCSFVWMLLYVELSLLYSISHHKHTPISLLYSISHHTHTHPSNTRLFCTRIRHTDVYKSVSHPPCTNEYPVSSKAGVRKAGGRDVDYVTLYCAYMSRKIWSTNTIIPSCLYCITRATFRES